LVSTGAVWKYLDDGSDQGTVWQGLLFNDSAWAAGPAQLGYGDGDEATVVNGGPPNNRFVTTYFRNSFLVDDLLGYTNLAIRLLRGAGGVVYLNGTPIFRSNMPTNDITYTTLALGAVQPVDQSTNFYARAVDPSLLLFGLNLLAVEIHQFSLTNSDCSFDLSLVGDFSPTPPTVGIVSPTNGAALLRANITLSADAHDLNDAITGVEFFQGGSSLGQMSAPPYSLVWSNVPEGSYTLTAVATDSRGLSSTSAPVTITARALIAHGAVWSYLDDGSDQGTAWQSLSFDDSSWATGPAQLGYGPANEATVINGGPSTNRIITDYFRRRFDVPDPSAWTNLVLRLLRDDGAIVYLNGTEVFRSNMPDGPVNDLTWAAKVVPIGPQESEFYSTRVDPALLLPGQNVLAVEIHQANNTSSDLNFDLELIPNVPPIPPSVSITNLISLTGGSTSVTSGLVAPATFEIDVDASAFDSTVAQVQIYLGAAMLGASTNEPFSLIASNVSAGHYLLYAVAVSSSGMAATSAPIALTVAGAPISTTLIATGSVWKYLDTGATNLGTAWKEIGFDDSPWPSGPAILGYGNASKSPPRPEATLINATNLNGKIITDYFRRQFVASSDSGFTNLSFGVLRDDGVVAYLNGSEIFRMNMPTGSISYASNSLAAVVNTDETNFFPTNISSALLLNGTNLLAVELHQFVIGKDAAFDLSLDGIAPPYTGPLALSITNTGSGLFVKWKSTGAFLETADRSSGSWLTLTSVVASPYLIMPTNGSKFYRLRQP
jgi:hypothetical protein